MAAPLQTLVPTRIPSELPHGPVVIDVQHRTDADHAYRALLQQDVLNAATIAIRGVPWCELQWCQESQDWSLSWLAGPSDPHG